MSITSEPQQGPPASGTTCLQYLGGYQWKTPRLGTTYVMERFKRGEEKFWVVNGPNGYLDQMGLSIPARQSQDHKHFETAAEAYEWLIALENESPDGEWTHFPFILRGNTYHITRFRGVEGWVVQREGFYLSESGAVPVQLVMTRRPYYFATEVEAQEALLKFGRRWVEEDRLAQVRSLMDQVKAEAYAIRSEDAPQGIGLPQTFTFIPNASGGHR